MTAFFIFSIPFSKRSQLNFIVEQSRQKTNVQGNVPFITKDSNNEFFFASFISFLKAAKISSTSSIEIRRPLLNIQRKLLFCIDDRFFHFFDSFFQTKPTEFHRRTITAEDKCTRECSIYYKGFQQ